MRGPSSGAEGCAHGHRRAHTGAHAPWGHIGAAFSADASPHPCSLVRGQLPARVTRPRVGSGADTHRVGPGQRQWPMVWCALRQIPVRHRGTGPQGGGAGTLLRSNRRGLPAAGAGSDRISLEPLAAGPQLQGMHVQTGLLQAHFITTSFALKKVFPLGIPFLSPERASIYINSTLTWDTPWARRTAGT